MKNVMVYVSPQKEFNRESSFLVKLQIDNSYQLGWESKDIILLTNFPYEYGGIKSTIVSDKNYCDFRPLSVKTITVANSDLSDCWVHDLDAFQLEKFDIDMDFDLGCTDYGWSTKWSLGSYFYTKRAKDILEKIRDTIYEIHNEDERALVHLTSQGLFVDRIKKLNITYNLGMRNIEENYKRAEKPLKVAHFHPTRVGLFDKFKPILNKRIIKLFYNYGIV